MMAPVAALAAPKIALRGSTPVEAQVKLELKKRRGKIGENLLQGGGFTFVLFSTLPGQDFPIWRAYFSDGLKPLTSFSF